MRTSSLTAALLAAILLVGAAHAGYTNNIMLTGYWPPTNEMIRPFSTNPAQNPGGWIGEDWERRGYDVYSYFPEVELGGKGTGDFEIDYQDTSADWWRITSEVKPLAIITFSWTSGKTGYDGKDWELETRNRNRTDWVDDFVAPFKPEPNPPDASLPAFAYRYSSLPLWQIRASIAQANVGVEAYFDSGTGGNYLSEYIGYHGLWYQGIHSDPNDPNWCVAAGHIHVGQNVTTQEGFAGTAVTLRALMDYLDTVVPEPTSLALFSLLLLRRRAA